MLTLAKVYRHCAKKRAELRKRWEQDRTRANMQAALDRRWIRERLRASKDESAREAAFGRQFVRVATFEVNRAIKARKNAGPGRYPAVFLMRAIVEGGAVSEAEVVERFVTD